MEMLKKLPINYVGELHQVQLINFSVDMQEVLPGLPPGLQVRDFQGRALISLVNVQLRNMQPGFLPQALHFNYQHIGFRLLVDDSHFNAGQAKGIFFLRSFTNKALMVQAGRLLTNYRLEKAVLDNRKGGFELRQQDRFLRYQLKEEKPAQVNENLKQVVGALDRAYSSIGDQLVRVQIMRECWPIRPVNCENFETNFFETARFEGAFQVEEVIPYKWLPPQPVVL